MMVRNIFLDPSRHNDVVHFTEEKAIANVLNAMLDYMINASWIFTQNETLYTVIVHSNPDYVRM